MNVIVQADHIIPEEMAKIQNQVESRTVKTEMITNETTYSITSKISTTKRYTLLISIFRFFIQPMSSKLFVSKERNSR